MLQSSRKTKKIQKKRLLILLTVGLFFAVFIFMVTAYYIYNSTKPLYISPLPSKGTLNDSPDGKLINSIKSGLKKQNIEYEEIENTDGKFVVKLKNKSQIIFSDKKDIKTQLSSLQLILARLTMEGKLFSQLDMRFDKPVVRIKSL